MQEKILKFFNVQLSEIKELAERLRRIGNKKYSSMFYDTFKLLNVLELYSREDWTDKDKFIAISNYLEYEDDHYRFSSLFEIPFNKENYSKFRSIIAINNLEQFKKQYYGSKYKDLIQSHVRKMDLVKIEMAILSSIAAFTLEEKEIARITLENYLQKGENTEFWYQDCSKVLSNVCSTFKELFNNSFHPEDKIQFNVFQLLTLFFASNALQSKKFRKHIGIRKSFLFK